MKLNRQKKNIKKIVWEKRKLAGCVDKINVACAKKT